MSSSYSAHELASVRKSKSQKYLTFFLNGEDYGIEILKINEIIGCADITIVPNCPKYIRGVLNLRGKILPVMDLRLRFDMEFKKYDALTSIIIINHSEGLMGIVVDEVQEVIDIDLERIEETPIVGTQLRKEFFSGVAKIKDRLKILLNIDNILGEEIQLTNVK